ncbi:MAG: phenylacetate--CoA ligase [Proteobacteria bacterium]|nr:phenylacetate--CoA ligase [Pseudomonadota bacterium]
MKNKDFITQEELESIQLKRLQDTVHRVYHLVPHYKKSFDKAGIHPAEIRSLADLSRLPFTFKKDLRDNYPFGMFAVNKDQIVRIHSSSGTTGKLTVVGYTAHDMEIWNEVLMRSMLMNGVTASDTVLNAFGYGLFTGGLGTHYGAEKLGCTVVPSGGGFTSRQLMLMKDFEATILCATPSFAMHLHETAVSEGYDVIKEMNLTKGFFGAEPASEGLKKEIANAWGIEYVETYGLSEIIGPGVSCSCGKGAGLHIFEDHFYPEIVDPETEEVLPYGTLGELVFTTITKQGIPLIRYRTRDLSTLTKDVCKCGRTLVRMTPVVGRSDDMLIVNGVNIFPSQVEHVLSLIEDVTLNYQIIADKKGFTDKLAVQVEANEQFGMDDSNETKTLENRIKNDLHNHLSINATVQVMAPQSLERSIGKAVRVIDKRVL